MHGRKGNNKLLITVTDKSVILPPELKIGTNNKKINYGKYQSWN